MRQFKPFQIRYNNFTHMWEVYSTCKIYGSHSIGCFLDEREAIKYVKSLTDWSK